MPKKNGRVNRKLLLAVYHGRNYVRGGKYVVNHIGETTYISFDDLKPEEIIAIGKFKKKIAS
jgi:hypothetical protein